MNFFEIIKNIPSAMFGYGGGNLWAIFIFAISLVILICVSIIFARKDTKNYLKQLQTWLKKRNSDDFAITKTYSKQLQAWLKSLLSNKFTLAHRGIIFLVFVVLVSFLFETTLELWEDYLAEILAGVTIYIAIWGVLVTRPKLQATPKQDETDEANPPSARLEGAIQNLESDKLSIRNAGIRILEQLAVPRGIGNPQEIEEGDPHYENLMLICNILNDFIREGAGVADTSKPVDRNREEFTDLENAIQTLGKIMLEDKRRAIGLSNLNLQKLNLSNVDLHGAALWNANLRRAELQGANLQGADLQEAKLMWANLQEANLQEAKLQEANLQEANLMWANLQEANLMWANLQEAKLQEANLWEATLWKALQEAGLKGANLQEADLQWTELQEANLHETKLQETNLQRANLLAATLQGANLQGANLQGADLQEANLHETKLQETNLQRANLLAATLQGANLHGADLQEANLQAAELHGAILHGADLSQTINLNKVKSFHSAIYDNETKWPEGFTPPPDAINVDDESE